MLIEGEGIDDILTALYPRLLDEGSFCEGLRGPNTELLGVTLKLSRPRRRLSRSRARGRPFSAIGELLWYLSGSDRLDDVAHYIPRYAKESEDGFTLPGAYGPRLRAMDGHIDQLENVALLLEERRTTKRAVIQLFDATDIVRHRSEIPCTTTMQFLLRDDGLHMSVTMRSNDAYLGLPHDVFAFTMIQEMMARRVRAEPSSYIHYVGSMHLYDNSLESARKYLDEGIQEGIDMPSMPEGDPFVLVNEIIAHARSIRTKNTREVFATGLDPYWDDLVLLLVAHEAIGDDVGLSKVADALSHRPYANYILDRMGRSPRERYEPREPELEF